MIGPLLTSFPESHISGFILISKYRHFLKPKHNYNSQKMDIEERLAEEVLRHEHLYSPSLSTHEHVQMTANSWREISASVGLDVQECIEGWRKMVDEYVFFHQMSWLDPYIEDSETSSNYDNKVNISEQPLCARASSVIGVGEPHYR